MVHIMLNALQCSNTHQQQKGDDAKEVTTHSEM
jgi:hypothetical protein